MKRQLSFLLLLALMAGLLSMSALAAEPGYSFELAVDGTQYKRVATGDIITVTFTLKRTDSSEPYSIYAMQNEICYDSEFFRLVEGSWLTTANVVTNDIALRDHHRAFYMNYLSMGMDSRWNSTTLVGSFQLEVIGSTGAARISSRNPQVARPDGSGSYTTSVKDVLVVLSDQCKVTFETAGGTSVSPQTVTRGGTVQQPADPSRYGYLFSGWYRDIDCTEPWSFGKDVVDVNLHLYAKWTKDESASRYTDVKKTDWFYGDVEYVSVHGLMDGVGNGKFAPVQSTSRAMIVTILWRLEGKPAPDAQMTFRDVPARQWYTEAIGWAAENGIVTGYSAQTFGPTDSVTREQLAAILYRYASYKGYDTTARADLSRFVDSSKVSFWAQEALSWANAAGLVNGMPGNLLAPQGTADRSQTAAILHRFCINVK